MKDAASSQLSAPASASERAFETPGAFLQHFRLLLASLTTEIANRPLDAALERWLNRVHGPSQPAYAMLREVCVIGVREGWLCTRERGGIRYGRVFGPTDDLNRFSADVVDMRDVVGPQHRHPEGEIDLVLPIDRDARFDGRGAGWCVYPAHSAHSPTVSGGRALVLYLLPEGSIDFSAG